MTKFQIRTRPNDTPLSYEGTIMAMETGSFFGQLNLKGKIDKMMVSPALLYVVYKLQSQ
jgi:hypothetical protein